MIDAKNMTALPDPKGPCPCGSGAIFQICCARIHGDHARAQTAEELMRSRYSAHVARDHGHLQRTWHPSTRPKKIDLDTDDVRWISLVIETCEAGKVEDSQGTVSFIASYIRDGYLCHLKETSAFVQENGLWYYLDGQAANSCDKISRNRPCPCGSGKKFKQCCL